MQAVPWLVWIWCALLSINIEYTLRRPHLLQGNAGGSQGDRGVGEIPPNATLEFEVQLLSVKTSPFGFQTKVVEG